MHIHGVGEKRTGIYPVEIVEIWGESKSLDGAIDVLLDMLWLVCDFAVTAI